jgi:hypothetical protein
VPVVVGTLFSTMVVVSGALPAIVTTVRGGVLQHVASYASNDVRDKKTRAVRVVRWMNVVGPVSSNALHNTAGLVQLWGLLQAPSSRQEWV